MATRMGSERKRKGKAPAMIDSCVRRRKPLSDCSNILTPRKSPSTVIPKPTPNLFPATPSRTRQVRNSTVASNPRTRPADPASVPTTPSPVSGRSERSVFQAVLVPVGSVFKRLRDDLGGERVDAVTKPNSKPRVKKNGVSSGKKSSKALGGERVGAVTKPNSKPRVEKNHGVSSGKKSSKDMEEYIRQQKSYFEEIDAFELLVEEVSDEELE